MGRKGFGIHLGREGATGDEKKLGIFCLSWQRLARLNADDVNLEAVRMRVRNLWSSPKSAF